MTYSDLKTSVREYLSLFAKRDKLRGALPHVGDNVVLGDVLLGEIHFVEEEINNHPITGALKG